MTDMQQGANSAMTPAMKAAIADPPKKMLLSTRSDSASVVCFVH
jgi:hypothetical protein